jgi:predicted dehydrogenase
VKLVEQKDGAKPRRPGTCARFSTTRRIDAVSIVTPNHWHALATIWACQAGKHVYVEKPASHNIWEGRKMVEAARKYGRRVQVGLNNRSSRNVIEAMAFLHGGGIGEVFLARALCFKARDSYGQSKDSQPPATFHYDRWLGPAPARPYNEKRSHYNWHWYWDTGNGDTGNTGPHQLDLARWGMNKNEHPVAVYSAGGLFGFQRQDAPESDAHARHQSVWRRRDLRPRPHESGNSEYADRGVTATPTARSSNSKRAAATRTTRAAAGRRWATCFFGSEGWLELGGSTWKAFRRRGKESFAGSKEGEAGWKGEHWGNFLDALRSGKTRRSAATSSKAISRPPCPTSRTSRIASTGR